MGSNLEAINYGYEPLDQEEIVRLHKKFMAGDGTVSFKLAVAVLPLMVSLAKRYYPQYFDKLGLEDFSQEILLFLVVRLPLYDESRGAFTTWVGWELRHFAADKFRRAGNLVKIPSHVFAKDKSYIEPLVYSDCDFSGFNSRTLEPWEYAAENEAIEQAKALVDLMLRLTPKEQKRTIRLRFVKGKTYTDIAKLVNISRQGVHVRCETAVQRVHQHFRMLGKSSLKPNSPLRGESDADE